MAEDNGKKTVRLPQKLFEEDLVTEEEMNESITELRDELETKASIEFLNNMLGGLQLIQMTQAEYDALEEKDSNTLYIIIN